MRGISSRASTVSPARGSVALPPADPIVFSDGRPPWPTVVDVTDTLSGIAEELATVWPSFLDEVLLPAEEDLHGVIHNVRRNVRCAVGVARVVEVPLADLVRGERCCTSCVPSSLAPGGVSTEAVAHNTRLLRTAVSSHLPLSARALAATLAIWGDYSRFVPREVFARLRSEHLLPLLYASSSAPSSLAARGPLVAFTAGDMRLGAQENPVLYDAYARSAGSSLLHASPHDGVWVLHDPLRGGSAHGMWPPLGKVVEMQVTREDVDPAVYEIFGTFADDALTGSGSWEDLSEWWSAAKRLA
jgi:hypothetical protein